MNQQYSEIHTITTYLKAEMSSIKIKSSLIIVVALIALCSISSCRTHGKGCPSYGSVAKSKKQA